MIPDRVRCSGCLRRTAKNSRVSHSLAQSGKARLQWLLVWSFSLSPSSFFLPPRVGQCFARLSFVFSDLRYRLIGRIFLSNCHPRFAGFRSVPVARFVYISLPPTLVGPCRESIGRSACFSPAGLKKHLCSPYRFIAGFDHRLLCSTAHLRHPGVASSVARQFIAVTNTPVASAAVYGKGSTSIGP